MQLVEAPTCSEAAAGERASLESSSSPRTVAAGKVRKEKGGKGHGPRVQSTNRKSSRRTQGTTSSGNHCGRGKGHGKSSQQTSEPTVASTS